MKRILSISSSYIFRPFQVVTVQGGLAECLGLCLDATSQFGIQCRSVVFYYKSNECILNRCRAVAATNVNFSIETCSIIMLRETRLTVPQLFGPIKDDTLVDYFENNCFDGNI